MASLGIPAASPTQSSFSLSGSFETANSVLEDETRDSLADTLRIQDNSSVAGPPTSPTKSQTPVDPRFVTPIRKRARQDSASTPGTAKRVTFMKAVEQEPPSSSPVKGATPLRSILKHSSDDAPWMPRPAIEPSTDAWAPGSIIQLDPASERTTSVINGCIKALSEPNFAHRFEAYASINYTIKMNSADFIVRTLLGKLKELVALVKRDTEDFIAKLGSTNKADAFELRVEVQAVKTLGFLLSHFQLCNLIDPQTLRGFLANASLVIRKPNFSKSIVAAYPQLIRDHKVPNSVVGSTLGEALLTGVIEIRTVSSVSLMIEQIATLRNFVLRNRAFMAKRLPMWLGFVCNCLCEMGVGGNDKVTRMVSMLLTEAVLQFDDIPDTKLAAFQFLNKTPAEPDSRSPSKRRQALMVEVLADRLKRLISEGNVSMAMVIWSNLTLMLNKFTWTEGIESWGRLNVWLDVPIFCFKQGEQYACEALRSWSSLVTIVASTFPTTGSLSVIPSGAKDRLNTLMLPFKLCQEYIHNDEVVEQFDDLYKRIYIPITKTYMRKSVTKDSIPLVTVLWDCCLCPPLNLFYFARHSTPVCIGLGVSMVSIMFNGRPGNSTLQRSAKATKSGLTTGMELLPLGQRWIISVEPNLGGIIADAFAAPTMTLEQRRTLLTSFMTVMSKIVPFVQNSQKSFYLRVVYHTRFLVKELIKCSTDRKSLTIDEGLRILLSVKDKFDIDSIVVESTESPSCCSAVVSYFLDSQDSCLELCESIMRILGKKDASFLVSLAGFQEGFLNEFVVKNLQQRLSGKPADLAPLALAIGRLAPTREDLVNLVLFKIPLIPTETLVGQLGKFELDTWHIETLLCFIEKVNDKVVTDKSKTLSLCWKAWVGCLARSDKSVTLSVLLERSVSKTLPHAFYIKAVETMLAAELSPDQLAQTATLVAKCATFLSEDDLLKLFACAGDRFVGLACEIPGYTEWAESQEWPEKDVADTIVIRAPSDLKEIPQTPEVAVVDVPATSEECNSSDTSLPKLEVPASNSDSSTSNDSAVVDVPLSDALGSPKRSLDVISSTDSSGSPKKQRLSPKWDSLNSLLGELCTEPVAGLPQSTRTELENKMLRLMLQLKSSPV